MTETPLARAVALIEADPRSGQALLLYALLRTLATEQGGHMYMLKKLREFNPENRQLAYALMDLMAAGGNCGPAWEQALERIDMAVKGRKYQ